MSLRMTRLLMLLGLTAFYVHVTTRAQELDAGKERTLKVAGGGGQPSFVLKISGEGSRGLVEVRTEKGTEVQTLVCPLLRDNPAPSEPELAAVREQFVTRFGARDLNFDGNADLTGIREFGAKWARYCVWLYDAKQHVFVKDFLAEQMELLQNLAALMDGRIMASHIGPANPWHAVYRISDAAGSQPEHQLIPVYSCLVETTADGKSPTAIVTARYEGGQAIVKRQEAGQLDMRVALGKCGSLERTWKSQNPEPK